MRQSQSPGARLLFRTILLLSALTLLLWEFKHRAASQPTPFATAESALKAGQWDKARIEFDTALKSRPTDPLVYEGILSTCATAAGSARTQATQKCWYMLIDYGKRALEACKRQPAEDQAVLCSLLGNAYAQVEPAHRQVQALSMAHRALDLQPHNSLLQNEYGYLLADNALGKGPDVTEALRLLQEALIGLQNGSRFSLDGDTIALQIAETEDSYGWALYKDEQYPSAITTLTKALYDYPENRSPELNEMRKVSYYHLAMAYKRSGQAEQARNAFQSALYYDSDYPEAREGLKTLDSATLSSAPKPIPAETPPATPRPPHGPTAAPAPGWPDPIETDMPPYKKK